VRALDDGATRRARVDARGRDAIERGRDGEPRREGGGGGDHVARACADDDAMAMTSKRK
jgi:hypothetical protein